jgi:hypothetical protein
MIEKTARIVEEIKAVLSNLSMSNQQRLTKKMQLLNSVDGAEWAAAVRAINDWMRKNAEA